MAPNHPRFDSAYQRLRNSEISGYQPVSARVGANRFNFRLSKLRITNLGAIKQRAVCQFVIKVVLGWCGPPEVVQRRVPPVAVAMRALHAIGAWTKKGLRHKAMDQIWLTLAVANDVHHRVPMRFTDRWLQHGLCSASLGASSARDNSCFTANPAQIRNGVKTFAARYRAPYLVVHLVLRGNLRALKLCI